MPTYHHEAIREEMIFHISMKDGLSEFDQGERWAKAAGAARSLRVVNGFFNDDPETVKGKMREFWEDSVEAIGSDNPPVSCNDEEMRKNLNHGYLFGIARAWAIAVNEQPHLGKLYGPKRQTTESFKYPRNQSTSERRHNVSTRA